MTDIQALYYGRHRTTFRIGTYLALVRMMGIHHLVTALYGHSRLAADTHARLARTRQTIVDLIVGGFDSDAGRAAVHRLREVHRHVPADADDYRYVLGTFFLEPLRWNACHAKVQVSAEEGALLLAFWDRVGAEMGIPDRPETLDGWRAQQAAYEARRMGHSPEGERLARLCLRDVVKLTVPWGMRWAFRQVMLGTLEPSVRTTLRLPAVSRPMRPAVGALTRWLA